MSDKKSPLRDTRWLAERLGLSISMIEWLRANQPPELPPCVKLGAVYRYSKLNQWDGRLLRFEWLISVSTLAQRYLSRRGRPSH